MYCPYCATWLDGGASRCSTCERDLRPVVAALASGERPAGDGMAPGVAQDGRWRQRRHSLGLLLVLCSLLAGCLIPVGLGLFAGAPWLGALVTTLAGVAGLLLLLGAMLLLAAEGQILTSAGPRGAAARPALPLHGPGAAGDADRQGAPARRRG